MVELQSSEVLPIGTALTLSAFDTYQALLSFTSSLLLCQIGLVAAVCVRILALPRAVLGLPASQRFLASLCKLLIC